MVPSAATAGRPTNAVGSGRKIQCGGEGRAGGHRVAGHEQPDGKPHDGQQTTRLVQHTFDALFDRVTSVQPPMADGDECGHRDENPRRVEVLKDTGEAVDETLRHHLHPQGELQRGFLHFIGRRVAECVFAVDKAEQPQFLEQPLHVGRLYRPLGHQRQLGRHLFDGAGAIGEIEHPVRQFRQLEKSIAVLHQPLRLGIAGGLHLAREAIPRRARSRRGDARR